MNYGNLTLSQRTNRILLGAALIVVTMLINALPLGMYALLPLLATYPIFTGIYGNDPLLQIVRGGVSRVTNALDHIHVTTHRSKHS